MVRSRNVERRRNPFEYSGFLAARVRNLSQLRSETGRGRFLAQADIAISQRISASGKSGSHPFSRGLISEVVT